MAVLKLELLLYMWIRNIPIQLNLNLPLVSCVLKNFDWVYSKKRMFLSFGHQRNLVAFEMKLFKLRCDTKFLCISDSVPSKHLEENAPL